MSGQKKYLIILLLTSIPLLSLLAPVLAAAADDATALEAKLQETIATYGENDVHTALAMCLLANAYEKQKRYQEQLLLREKIFKICAKNMGEKNPATISVMYDLAYAYTYLGRNADALPLYKKVFELRLETLGEKHPDSISSMNTLALTYSNLGSEAEALPLYEKVLKLRTEMLKEKHPKTIDSMYILAITYNELGRYAEALAFHEKVFRLRTEILGDNHPDTISSINSLAVTYCNIGRYAQALALSKQALARSTEILGENHPDTVSCMNTLAQIYDKLGYYSDAMQLEEKIYGLRLELLGERDNATLETMNNLALIYDDLGYHDKARALQEKVLSYRTETLGENHPDTIGSMGNLAITYRSLGRNTEALALEEKTFVLFTKVYGENHPDTITSLCNLARTYGLNHAAKAQATYEKAVAGIEYLRQAGSLSVENRQALFAQHIDTYKQLSSLYVIYNQPIDAFRIAELSKARTLLESSTARLADQSAILPPAEAAKLRDYDARLSRLNNAITKAFAQPDRKIALETEKDQLVQESNAYRRTLMIKYHKYAQLNNVKVIGATEGQQLIPQDTIFVSYLLWSVGESNVITVFTLSADKGLKAEWLGEVPHLNDTLAAYVRKLQGKKVWLMADGSYCKGNLRPDNAVRQVENSDEIGSYLGEKLLKPLQAELTEKHHWIISGDGAMSMIPFETLILDGHAAIDSHDISYIQSLSMLRLLQERDHEYQKLNGRKSLFAMGSAEYQEDAAVKRGTTANDDDQPEKSLSQVLHHGYSRDAEENAFNLLNIVWDNLPSSETELNNLATIFGVDAVIFKKRNASEAKLLELNSANELSKYRYIVFSTHGYFCTQEPGLSAVVLNQLHKTPDTDGYITAVKWPSYNFKSDLMVLSACETGVGKVIQGEGISGLPFALYVAGNKNTVFTLWSVVDESSTKFTQSFFQKIKTGKKDVEALNETKREFKNCGQYANPLYWAPFVLYGI